jgi:hypothetical protein
MVNDLSPITLEEDVLRCHHLAAGVVQRSSEGILMLARRADWVAVPVESTCHFSKEDERRLVLALQQRGMRVVYAVALEPVFPHPSVYAVAVSLPGIQAFNRETSHLNFVLFDEDVTCAIICTTDDYFVVSGPAEFVRITLESEIDEAFAAFERFATEPHWPDRSRRMLLSVLKALHVDYPMLLVGDSVTFPQEET